jgi:hypothetical protein
MVMMIMIIIIIMMVMMFMMMEIKMMMMIVSMIVKCVDVSAYTLGDFDDDDDCKYFSLCRFGIIF